MGGGAPKRMKRAHRASFRMSGSESESLSAFWFIDSDTDADSDPEVFYLLFPFSKQSPMREARTQAHEKRCGVHRAALVFNLEFRISNLFSKQYLMRRDAHTSA
jgi:hypothetical protein